jgi:hypothetical protein
MSNDSAEMNLTAGRPGIRRVGMSSLALLAVLTLALAFHYLGPKSSAEAPRTKLRVGWYLRSGQWHADVRTLAAAFQYLMTPDENTKSWTNSPTNQLATATSEAGWNPPSTNDLSIEWKPASS